MSKTFQNSITDKLPTHMKMALSLFRGIVNPEMDLRNGPVARIFALAHLATAMENPNAPISVATSSDRQSDVTTAIRKAVKHEVKQLPGKFRVTGHTVTYLRDKTR